MLAGHGVVETVHVIEATDVEVVVLVTKVGQLLVTVVVETANVVSNPSVPVVVIT